jgi:hypothetical protein
MPRGTNSITVFRGAAPEKVLDLVPLGMPRGTISSTFSGAVPWSKC